jgi:hypothetical protein
MSRFTFLAVAASVLIFAAPTTVSADSTSGPPSVHLDSYTGKPTHSFAFSGNGLAPGEAVDVYLGDQCAGPLATVSADSQGAITAQTLSVPLMTPGDYQLVFVGQSSHTPATVGFNVQGFHPWVVLNNYYVKPQSGVGFSGDDFVPGEPVQVYLNSRLSQPVAQVTADANGHFGVDNAFPLPNVTGNNQLIFVSQQSQTEVTATFAAATNND